MRLGNRSISWGDISFKFGSSRGGGMFPHPRCSAPSFSSVFIEIAEVVSTLWFQCGRAGIKIRNSMIKKELRREKTHRKCANPVEGMWIPYG
jgi:hypothetical protein